MFTLSRPLSLICLLLLAATGCQLGAAATEPTAIIVTATLRPATATPRPTSTPATTADTGDVIIDEPEQATLPECTITHTEWPAYTIQPGDTLATIAAWAGADVNTLATANCLANPDVISVGQTLYVPQLPPAPEPPPSLPVIDHGPPPATVCAVVPNFQQANIYGPGDSPGPVAILAGPASLERVADNAYILDTPSLGFQGWVSAMDTHLTGNNCPGTGPEPLPDDLPVVGGSGEPPADGCSVVRNPGINQVPVFYGPGDAFAPIATLGSYAPYVSTHSGGYEISLPGLDHNGWVAASGDVSLSGSGCDQSTVQCLPTDPGAGVLSVSPSSRQSRTCASINAGLITVTWPDAPATFEMVEFWRVSGNGNTDVIGVDRNPADGASITWQVPPGTEPGILRTIPYARGGIPPSAEIAIYLAD